ncbi:retinoid-inducible serine carboxypeptidase-like [Anopheles aquasalis]|uniref:retinoid-inducible serine carboxypeptidase-like n=1 Tax=Anopheles aquasalis TaxID=42839 RepID=UPI00215AD55B|nr:retinoid-inducible serine carboxypeptidase-like [Anopheles aquasalis]
MLRDGWMSCLIVLYSILRVTGANQNGFGPGRQSWGYSEVRPGAFLFWWLHYATTDNHDFTRKPLIIWLQGGPGASSTGFGNFEEIGPLDRTLNNRGHSWVHDHNVLFVDSPVGSGYSYVQDLALLASNSSTIVTDLMQLLATFYATTIATTGFDWERHVPLYIASQSYGGRIAVEFAYALVQAVRRGQLRCKLVGLLLGSAWLSPIDSISAWPDYLEQLGYIGPAGRMRLERQVEALQELTPNSWEAVSRAEPVMDSWHSLQQAVIRETNGINCYHVLKPKAAEGIEPSSMMVVSDADDEELLEYGETAWYGFGRASSVDRPTIEPVSRPRSLEHLMRGPVSKALGLNDKPPWGALRNAVFEALASDFLESSTETVLRLLHETTDLELVLYNGHLDLIACLPGTIRWLERLFNRTETTVRESFPLPAASAGQPIEGYRTVYYGDAAAPRLTLYTVLRAGHMIPADNPTAMAHILKAHVKQLPQPPMTCG